MPFLFLALGLACCWTAWRVPGPVALLFALVGGACLLVAGVEVVR